MRWLLVALLSGGCVVEQQSPIADDAGGRDAESEGEQRFQPPDRDEDEEDAELPREDRDAAFAEGGAGGRRQPQPLGGRGVLF